MHLMFTDFVRNQVVAVVAIYDAFELDFSDKAKLAKRAFSGEHLPAVWVS